MARLVRELFGVPKPKGKDDLAPEADDPPWPDVKVVVIVNKRSGSRLVRPLVTPAPFSSSSDSCAPFPATHRLLLPLTRPSPAPANQGKQLARKLVEVRSRTPARVARFSSARFSLSRPIARATPRRRVPSSKYLASRLVSSRLVSSVSPLGFPRVPPQANCGVIYLDEYLRRRDALMAKLVSLVSSHRSRDDLRFVAAGGDGTVSWVAELIHDACALVGTRNVPPIAILSLGTGNELARVTGWGATYAGHSLVPFVRDVAFGKVIGVDSWLWRATPLDVGPDGRILDRPRRNARAPERVVGERALHDFGAGSAREWNAVAEDGFATESSPGNEPSGAATADARGVEDSFAVGTDADAPPPASRRLSMSAARRFAAESSDLPHLPEMAFAPPPMTPPGASPAKSAKSRMERKTKTPPRALAETAETRGPVPIVMGPTRSSTENAERGIFGETRRASESNGNANGTPSSSTRPAHRRGGSAGGSGPANNGIGFGRRARTQSRGSSMDFAADGFDDISFDGSDAEEDGELGVVEKTSVCFFSVGFDASIAMQFHQLRERTPCCADSVTKIVAGHTVLGFAEAFAARKYLRPGVLSLRVDGREVAIPPGARTLQFFNIHSSATGIDFFGCDEPSTPEELQEYEPPNIGDGLIEIVATMSAWHLGAIRLGFGHSHRVAQGASVEMVLREPLPVQVDGEPWLQPPAVIHVSTRGKIPFVLGKGPTRNVPQMGHVRRPSVVPGGN